MNFKDPRFAILLDLPFTFTRTETAESVMASIGLGLQFRPKPWWSITPAFRVGGSGSFKLGALAVLYSGTVTNSMRFPLRRWTLDIGNQFGVTSTFDGIVISDVRLSYDLLNYVIRNGAELSHPLPWKLVGRRVDVGVFLTDTWFLGSELFLDHYNEVGVSFALPKPLGGGATYDRSQLRLMYVGGKGYDAFKLGMELRF